MKIVAALVIAALTFSAVAEREWNWRHVHPYELGPSGYIVALGVAGTIAAVALAIYVHQRNEDREAFEQGVWTQIRQLRERVENLTLDDVTLRQLELVLDAADPGDESTS